MEAMLTCHGQSELSVDGVHGLVDVGGVVVVCPSRRCGQRLDDASCMLDVVGHHGTTMR
jgi:hypothetical protein